MISSHHLLKEAFCCGNVALCRKHKLYRITCRINSSVKIFASLPDLDIGLIHSVLSACKFQMRMDSLVNLRSIFLYPPIDSCMID